ncbi:15825_t:CDS:1, partial [Racocetra persica]
ELSIRAKIIHDNHTHEALHNSGSTNVLTIPVANREIYNDQM